MKENVIIYHGGCTDGFAAMYVALKALGEENTEVVYGVYGEAPPDVLNKKVFIVDFCYDFDTTKKIIALAEHTVILDHHPLAKNVRDSLANDLKDAFIWYDPSESGASLSWMYFYPNKAIPSFINYVRDYDLWLHQLPYTREVNAYIRSVPQSIVNWEELEKKEVADMVSSGKMLLADHNRRVGLIIDLTTRMMTLSTFRQVLEIPVANCPPHYASDVCNKLSEIFSSSVAGSYYDTKDSRVFSLRSTEDIFNVNEIAQAYGGGGHPRASGFSVPRGHFLAQT